MIFGKTYAVNKTSDDWWKRKFTWLPVMLEDGRKVWLQFVETKSVWVASTWGQQRESNGHWDTRYRLIEENKND